MEINIVKNEELRLAKITLNGEQFRVESGAMYYMLGNIEMQSKLPSVGGMMKAALTNEKMVRPIYSGEGDLFLEPTAGHIEILELNSETWILESGSYLGSEMSVEVGIHMEKAFTSFKSGEGMINFQTKVSGTGKVLCKCQGPVEKINLNNGKLVVDGKFAFARTASLDFKCQMATKSIFGTATSGEGMVRVFEGTGTVLISPVPYFSAKLVREY